MSTPKQVPNIVQAYDSLVARLSFEKMALQDQNGHLEHLLGEAKLKLESMDSEMTNLKELFDSLHKTVETLQNEHQSVVEERNALDRELSNLKANVMQAEARRNENTALKGAMGWGDPLEPSPGPIDPKDEPPRVDKDIMAHASDERRVDQIVHEIFPHAVEG